MDAPLNQVLMPVSLAEFFAAWNRFPDAVPFAGGTNLVGKQEKNTIAIQPVFLCLEKIEELHRITRTEHYLEIGSMVKLNKLIDLGKIVPEVFRSCLVNIAGVQLRNIATIGGNICSTRLYDLPAVLIALDAQYELLSFGKQKNTLTSRWVAASRFHTIEVQTALEKMELLTRIRLPLYHWDYAVYKKFYNQDCHNSESLVFLAKIQKSLLSEIRVILKGNGIFRNKTCEDILNGKSLPLNKKIAADFVDNWSVFLAQKHEFSEFSMNSILNSIEENVYNLV
jgi:CO/xanthine dehydrogenase FAD-binding subunit